MAFAAEQLKLSSIWHLKLYLAFLVTRRLALAILILFLYLFIMPSLSHSGKALHWIIRTSVNADIDVT